MCNQNFHTFSDMGKIWSKNSEHNGVQCEFRENRHKEGRTFLMGVNEITFSCLLEPRTFRK